MGNVISAAALKQKTFKKAKVITYDVSLWRHAGGYQPSALLNYILAKSEGKPNTHICMHELARMMDCTTDSVYNWTLKLQKNKLIDSYVTTEKLEDGKIRRFRYFTVNIDYLREFKEGQAFLARFFRHTVKKASKAAKKLFEKKDKKTRNSEPDTSVDKGSDEKTYSTENENNVTYSSNKLLNISYLKIRGGTADASPSAPTCEMPADAGRALKGEGKEEVEMNSECAPTGNISIAGPLRGSVPLLEGELIEPGVEIDYEAIRAAKREKNDGRTRLSVDADLTGYYKAAIERSGIHYDHYDRVWEDFCFYWHEEAKGERARKKNWYRTWQNWLQSGITTGNKSLYKPLSKEKKEERRKFEEALFAQEGIPAIYNNSIGMTMFYGRKKARQQLKVTFGDLTPSLFITHIESTYGKQVFRKLRETDSYLAEKLYKSWFLNCSYEEESTASGKPVVTIHAPSLFVKAEIEKRFRNILEDLNMIVCLKKKS